MKIKEILNGKKLATLVITINLIVVMLILSGCGKSDSGIKTYEKENDDIANQLKNESNKTENDNKENAEISTKGKLSEEEALKLGVQLYNEALELNFLYDEENDVRYDLGDDISKMVEKHKDRFTENGLKKYLRCRLIDEKDGVYYQVGGGSDPTYLSHEIKVKKVEEDRIEYTIIGKYEENHYPGTTEKFEYSIVRNGNKWMIDEFAIPWSYQNKENQNTNETLTSSDTKTENTSNNKNLEEYVGKLYESNEGLKIKINNIDNDNKLNFEVIFYINDWEYKYNAHATINGNIADYYIDKMEIKGKLTFQKEQITMEITDGYNQVFFAGQTYVCKEKKASNANQKNDENIAYEAIRNALKDKEWLKKNVVPESMKLDDVKLTFICLKEDDDGTPMVMVQYEDENAWLYGTLISYDNGNVTAQNIAWGRVRVIQVDPNNREIVYSINGDNYIAAPHFKVENKKIKFIEEVAWTKDKYYKNLYDKQWMYEEHTEEEINDITQKINNEYKIKDPWDKEYGMWDEGYKEITKEEFDNIEKKYEKYNMVTIDTELNDTNIDKYIK